MSNKDAVGILRGIKDRIDNLEEAVSTTEGVPNLLRPLTERSTASDEVDARENDAAASDASTTSDSAAVSTGTAGGWTWGESNWNFDEWS
jgi:hypothetical protein